MHALFLGVLSFQFLFEFDVRQGPTWTAPRAGDNLSRVEEGGGGGYRRERPYASTSIFLQIRPILLGVRGPAPSPPVRLVEPRSASAARRGYPPLPPLCKSQIQVKFDLIVGV
jgi:hypothetical protein